MKEEYWATKVETIPRNNLKLLQFYRLRLTTNTHWTNNVQKSFARIIKRTPGMYLIKCVTSSIDR